MEMKRISLYSGGQAVKVYNSIGGVVQIYDNTIRFLDHDTQKMVTICGTYSVEEPVSDEVKDVFKNYPPPSP
jgi:hypothetical protein